MLYRWFLVIGKLRNKPSVLLSLCGGILLSAAFFAYMYQAVQEETVPEFNPAEYVEAMGKGETSVFEDVRESLDDVIRKWGVQAALDMNAYAFRQKKYGIYQCHVLTHLTGHEAVAYYGSDFESVINRDVHFCELGYQHGAEAQVALNGGDYKNELYRMCDIVQKRNPSLGCFHGAGHAFMNDSLDVHKALALCDGLINETHSVESMAPCYNSVFAELTNLVGGTDGATGMVYTGGPPLSIGEDSPIAFCAKFGERYKIQCMFEFSGLGISEFSSDADIEKKLVACSSGDFDEVLEAACIRSVSAVGAQHQLAVTDTVIVPKHIFGLPDVLRESYINGAGTEMKQYVISGVAKDWEGFCSSFTVEKDRLLCTNIFVHI